MIYYVDANSKTPGTGTWADPFRTISAAARIAQAGDQVLVLPGIYREEVDPQFGGTKEKPIVYRSLKPGEAVITGAEKAEGWVKAEGDVWKLAVPNRFFGTCNPYTTLVWGDWLNQGIPAHTGEVFLNGKSLYEQPTLEQVLRPEYSDASWDREFTKHTWYTCQDPEKDLTLIYANFQGADPNLEDTQFTVRPHCFYPSQEHVNYITLSGFMVTMAATQWAPPTALQDGMIGPHWSKGWVIENCDISLSKCCGISLGKYRQQGNDNKWSHFKYKDGAQTQRDCALIAQLDGWSKETVGSHTIRGCNIHHCGQTGIVGNLGCVFSVIENCHIHHINNKRNLAGAEIGGIKLHAAIDVIIRNSRFDHCTRGIWLDWENQGTRVTGCLFHDNCMPYDYLLRKENREGLGLGEDLFMEIAHGPCLVDNNVFLSERAVKLPTQGVAFVHNLFAGAICAVGRGVKNGTVKYDSTRYTPIHLPHRTEITGFMSILHGDVRFYNNVFLQQKVREGLIAIEDDYAQNEWEDDNLTAGTVPYSGYMTEEQWKACFEGYCGEGSPVSRDRYYMPLPVWTGGNVFLNGAQPADIEQGGTVFGPERHAHVVLEENPEKGTTRVKTDFLSWLPEAKLITSDTLGMAFEPEERFETPDGETIIFDTDMHGNRRDRIIAGPFNPEEEDGTGAFRF